MMYLQDYDAKVVPRYAACPSTGPVNPPTEADEPRLWEALLQPYVRNQGIFVCPSANNTKYADTWNTRSFPSIGYNQTISGWYWLRSLPCGEMILPIESEIKVPVKNVVFADSVSGTMVPAPDGNSYRGYLFGNAGMNVPYTAAYEGRGSFSSRHQEGTNLIFFDGHAHWYRGESLLGNPRAPFRCEDSSIFTGAWWMDVNGAHLKFNVTDRCIQDP
jgi:prepilin-type processing-associated H-X9-DG protein